MSSIPSAAMPHAKPATADSEAETGGSVQPGSSLPAGLLPNAAGPDGRHQETGGISDAVSSGIQAMALAYLEGSRSATEALMQDIADLASVRSPVQFFALQAKILNRNMSALLSFSAASRQQPAMLGRTVPGAATV